MFENKRYCERKNITEEKDLHYGMDFRNPRYRREVFLRFLEFQLKYKGHSGAIYYALQGIFEELSLTKEQRYWFTFINGCSQNVMTSFVIFNNFPDLHNLDLKKLENWYNENYKKISWDTDRRYTKNKFIACVENYKTNLNNDDQETFFEKYLCKTPNAAFNFDRLWKKVTGEFYTFGRVASFSYLRMLSVSGLNFEPGSLFMHEIDGSKSHRNGLCKVLGRDDLDWTRENKLFTKYEKSTLDWLEEEGKILLKEAKERFPHPDLNYLTLESALCSYKGWFRKNRRYPGVYNDILHDRIKNAEQVWVGHADFSVFWKIREKVLPEHLRVECNSKDPGYCKEKQNYFRETGKIINMDKDWECFKNEFYEKYQ